MTHTAFYHAALAVALGMGAQLLATRLAFPSIVALLVTGVVAGPDGLGLLDPTATNYGSATRGCSNTRCPAANGSAALSGTFSMAAANSRYSSCVGSKPTWQPETRPFEAGDRVLCLQTAESGSPLAAFFTVLRKADASEPWRLSQAPAT